jgi:hypothetical protein
MNDYPINVDMKYLTVKTKKAQGQGQGQADNQKSFLDIGGKGNDDKGGERIPCGYETLLGRFIGDAAKSFKIAEMDIESITLVRRQLPAEVDVTKNRKRTFAKRANDTFTLKWIEDHATDTLQTLDFDAKDIDHVLILQVSEGLGADDHQICGCCEEKFTNQPALYWTHFVGCAHKAHRGFQASAQPPQGAGWCVKHQKTYTVAEFASHHLPCAADYITETRVKSRDRQVEGAKVRELWEIRLYDAVDMQMKHQTMKVQEDTSIGTLHGMVAASLGKNPKSFRLGNRIGKRFLDQLKQDTEVGKEVTHHELRVFDVSNWSSSSASSSMAGNKNHKDSGTNPQGQGHEDQDENMDGDFARWASAKHGQRHMMMTKSDEEEVVHHHQSPPAKKSANLLSAVLQTGMAAIGYAPKNDCAKLDCTDHVVVFVGEALTKLLGKTKITFHDKKKKEVMVHTQMEGILEGKAATTYGSRTKYTAAIVGTTVTEIAEHASMKFFLYSTLPRMPRLNQECVFCTQGTDSTNATRVWSKHDGKRFCNCHVCSVCLQEINSNLKKIGLDESDVYCPRCSFG